MATGKIKKVLIDRSFGFITGDDGRDYFFHRDGLAGSLASTAAKGGEPVEFEVESSSRGPRAVNVRSAAR